MNGTNIYCGENCGNTNCKRHKVHACPNATYIGMDNFICCPKKMNMKQLHVVNSKSQMVEIGKVKVG